MKNEQIINGLTELDIANKLIASIKEKENTNVSFNFSDIRVGFSINYNRGGVTYYEEGTITASSDKKGELNIDDWDLYNKSFFRLEGTPIANLEAYMNRLTNRGILDNSNLHKILNIGENITDEEKINKVFSEMKSSQKLVIASVTTDGPKRALKAFEYLHEPQVKDEVFNALESAVETDRDVFPIVTKIGTLDIDSEGLYFRDHGDNSSNLGELTVLELLEFYNVYNTYKSNKEKHSAQAK